MTKAMLHSGFSRRAFLRGGAALAGVALAAPVRADAAISADTLGITPDSGADVTTRLQLALDQAASRGMPLFLPAGTYRAERLTLPSNSRLSGVPGATILQGNGSGPVLKSESASNITIEGIGVAGDRQSPSSVNLVKFKSVENLSISAGTFRNNGGNGVRLDACSGRIAESRFNGFGASAIHAQDSAGLILSGNVISDCDNGGIRVWRSTQGADGTIVTGNRISAIYSQSGNGQNGNGVNVFRANEVIVADNQITDCDFSAIRLNTTDNTIVRGNMCTNLREVAIFSEFAFSGSVIAENIVDDAAYGISMTNFNDGGRLAVCTGNLVRNIWPSSPTNPDTRPVGIMAQADAAVTGNVVENVPGVGIAAGWGPFLRDVLIANNSVKDCKLGIGISVAEGAGRVQVSGNLIAGSEYRAISGMAWLDPKGEDLVTKPDQFGNISASGNIAS